MSHKPASACLSFPGAEAVCVGGVLSSCMACGVNPRFTPSAETHTHSCGVSCHEQYEVGGSHLYLNWLCAVIYFGYGGLHVHENWNLTSSVFYTVPGTPYMHPSTPLPNLFFLV